MRTSLHFGQKWEFLKNFSKIFEIFLISKFPKISKFFEKFGSVENVLYYVNWTQVKTGPAQLRENSPGRENSKL